MASKDHLRVGQVLVNKEAFKLHMTLYAIANKFRYLVKRSERVKYCFSVLEKNVCGELRNKNGWVS